MRGRQRGAVSWHVASVFWHTEQSPSKLAFGAILMLCLVLGHTATAEINRDMWTQFQDRCLERTLADRPAKALDL